MWLLRLRDPGHWVIRAQVPFLYRHREGVRERSQISPHCRVSASDAPPCGAASPFVTVLSNQRRRDVSQRVMPQSGLPPVELPLLVWHGGSALVGQDIYQVALNQIAKGMALGCGGREVPTLKGSTLTDFCPFLGVSESWE